MARKSEDDLEEARGRGNGDWFKGEECPKSSDARTIAEVMGSIRPNQCWGQNRIKTELLQLLLLSNREDRISTNTTNSEKH